MIKPNYFIIPIVVFLTSTLGGFITSKGMDWYKGLNLPEITPPGYVISIAWTIIFILTAISCLIYYNKAFRNARFVFVITLFLINAGLNILWSYLFFNLHLVGAAILEMIILEATVLLLIYLVRPTSKLASALLYPYAAWVVFATYLAYQTLLLNT